MSAEALQQYASDLNTFGASPGADPMRQAGFYDPDTQADQIKTWANLYKAGAKGDGGLTV